MDWRVLLTTFGVIFLAEMGDKTQLAAMTMSAQSKRPWAVFIGASLALTAVIGSWSVGRKRNRRLCPDHLGKTRRGLRIHRHRVLMLVDKF